MERFLLFDSSCALCSQLASSIERESNGWLRVHSLREPMVQSLLLKANAPRRWKPTLIEVQGEDIRVFTGLRLELRLITGLGPRRSLAIAQIVYKTNTSQPGKTDVGRRSFFRRSGALLAGIALGFGLGNIIFDQNAHAQAMATEGNPLTITPVDFNDVVIKQLRQTDVVQRANIHFGTPDWQEVQKVEDYRTHETIYMIPYRLQKSSPLIKATFLSILEPSLQGLEKGFVGQLIYADAQTQEFVWLTPDNHYLVTTVGHKDREVEISTQNTYALGTKGLVAQPNINVSCFNTCLYAFRINNLCVRICDSCLQNPGSPVTCPACALCAGYAYTICLARCLFT